MYGSEIHVELICKSNSKYLRFRIFSNAKMPSCLQSRNMKRTQEKWATWDDWVSARLCTSFSQRVKKVTRVRTNEMKRKKKNCVTFTEWEFPNITAKGSPVWVFMRSHLAIDVDPKVVESMGGEVCRGAVNSDWLRQVSVGCCGVFWFGYLPVHNT